MTSAAAPAAITDFVAAYAEAWASGDVDAVAEAIGLPQMLARGDGTVFIEDDAGLVRWIEERLAQWAGHGIAGVRVDVAAVEDLPDDAARVTTRWRLLDADGTDVRSFAATDTLACDDGDWYVVVTDLAGEDAAWAGVS